MSDPLPMERALTTVLEARALLIVVLDDLEKRRDSRSEAEVLRAMVGDLAAMTDRWGCERARWVACCDERAGGVEQQAFPGRNRSKLRWS